jgi:FkbM family methyltransferase
MTGRVKSLVRAVLPRTIRPHVILAGPLRGYRIVTSWHDYPAAITGRTERPLLDWFAKNVKAGETWLDIGAHYGYTAIALSRLVGASGRVFAFEPMISTAGYVTQTRRLNNLPQWTVVPLGLANPGADAMEVRRLLTVRGMVDSTVREEGWGETIMVTSLDWLWPRLCGTDEQLHGVKVDVQGMELEALGGMLGILSKWKPKLVVEVHVGVDRSGLLGAIESAGYVRRGVPIEPVPGEIEPLYVDDHSYAFFPVEGVVHSKPNV